MKLWRNGEEGKAMQNDLHSATADELKAVLLAIKVVIKTPENSVPVPIELHKVARVLHYVLRPQSIRLERITIN
jgi:hypothetical protein